MARTVCQRVALGVVIAFATVGGSDLPTAAVGLAGG
jgi:hypothetical protein